MSFLTRVTPNNPATLIAWVSTCLLAAGAGTLLSEDASVIWMSWGAFGLTAAVGLDIAGRLREWRWTDDLTTSATRRFERDTKYDTEDKEARTAIREAVARMLGLSALKPAGSRRTKVRYPCDLDVELLLHQEFEGAADNPEACTQVARITNLSESGFELTLTEQLPQQRMPMIVRTENGGRENMFVEVLWYGPPRDGSIIAGGRFLDAAPIERV